DRRGTFPSDNQNAAARQQSGGMALALDRHLPGRGGEAASSRLVNLRRAQKAAVAFSPCHEDLAVKQLCSGVGSTRFGHRASRRKSAAFRIERFHRVQRRTGPLASGEHDSALVGLAKDVGEYLCLPVRGIGGISIAGLQQRPVRRIARHVISALIVVRVYDVELDRPPGRGDDFRYDAVIEPLTEEGHPIQAIQEKSKPCWL